jgi:hypothetical protein
MCKIFLILPLINRGVDYLYLKNYYQITGLRAFVSLWLPKAVTIRIRQCLLTLI